MTITADHGPLMFVRGSHRWPRRPGFSGTLHGSGPNRTDQPRRSFAIHLRTERSGPVGGERKGLTCFIDDPDYCPVIYRQAGWQW